MHRQTLVPGALEALERIGEVADIVILTNLGDEAHGWRVEQLAGHGIAPRGRLQPGRQGRARCARSSSATAPATTVFVDDLAGPSRVGRQACARGLAAAHDRRAAAGGGGAAGARRPCADRRLAGGVRLDPATNSRKARMTKTILITGATAGIGAAAARRFAAGGWRVIAHRPARRPAARAGRRARRRLPAARARHARPPTPSTSWPSCRRRGARSTCCSTMPAWRRRWTPLQDADCGRDRDVIDTNITGLVALTRALLPKLIERKGAIINLSSVAATYPYRGGAVYGAHQGVRPPILARPALRPRRHRRARDLDRAGHGRDRIHHRPHRRRPGGVRRALRRAWTR